VLLNSIADPDGGLTPTQAARKLHHLGVTPHTVSMWAARGWLDEHGRRHYLTVISPGCYRWADLIQAESDTRNNPNSRRRRAEVAA